MMSKEVKVLKGERLAVFNKYGGKCAYCGSDLNTSFHVDHLQPIERNYKWCNTKNKWLPDGMKYPERDCLDNKIPACASCNINKHSLDINGFRELITGFMKHLNEVSTQYKIAKRYGLVIEDIKPIVFYFETIENKAATASSEYEL